METFKMSITQSILLRITIVAYLWNWNNHSTFTHVIRIEIWAPCQNIFALQFPRPSLKFWKIVDFKSAISPPLWLQRRWVVFWNLVFLKEEFRYATCFFWFYAKSLRNWSESRRPILPFFFSHLCQGKCSDTRCGEPPAINNENAKILEHKRYFIDREPLRGGHLLWEISIQNNSWMLWIASNILIYKV